MPGVDDILMAASKLARLKRAAAGGQVLQGKTPFPTGAPPNGITGGMMPGRPGIYSGGGGLPIKGGGPGPIYQGMPPPKPPAPVTPGANIAVPPPGSPPGTRIQTPWGPGVTPGQAGPPPVTPGPSMYPPASAPPGTPLRTPWGPGVKPAQAVPPPTMMPPPPSGPPGALMKGAGVGAAGAAGALGAAGLAGLMGGKGTTPLGPDPTAFTPPPGGGQGMTVPPGKPPFTDYDFDISKHMSPLSEKVDTSTLKLPPPLEDTGGFSPHEAAIAAAGGKAPMPPPRPAPAAAKPHPHQMAAAMMPHVIKALTKPKPTVEDFYRDTQGGNSGAGIYQGGGKPLWRGD